MVLKGENIIELSCNCVGDCNSLIFYFDKEDNEIYVSIKSEGYCAIHNISFKERLKKCFKILFKKKIYLDDIILNKDDILKLKNELENFIQKG